MAAQAASPAWQQVPQATPTPVPPPQPSSNRMAGHVKAVAIINLVFAGFTALAALGVVFAFGIGSAAVGANEEYGAPRWVADMLASMALVLGLVFAAVAALYALAGFRLLSFKRSGKGLGIAASVVQVIVGLPTLFGAGLGLLIIGAGVYGLVILTRPDTEALLTA